MQSKIVPYNQPDTPRQASASSQPDAPRQASAYSVKAPVYASNLVNLNIIKSIEKKYLLMVNLKYFQKIIMI